MMEKQNRTLARKTSAGDSGTMDDIVDFAAKKMDAVRSAGSAGNRRARSRHTDEAAPQTMSPSENLARYKV